MGSGGKITRIVAPLIGGLFTYASLRPGKEVADGQIDRAALQRIWRGMKMSELKIYAVAGRPVLHSLSPRILSPTCPKLLQGPPV